MSDPIDFDRERRRRQPPQRPPTRWLWRVMIVAMVVYALVRAWQMWTHPLL